jgi:hypothetical protein
MDLCPSDVHLRLWWFTRDMGLLMVYAIPSDHVRQIPKVTMQRGLQCPWDQREQASVMVP